MASVKPLVTSTTDGLPEPVAAPTNGQVLIGDGTGYTAATLTAGSNVTITNGSGSITIAASGGGGGGGLTNWTEATASYLGRTINSFTAIGAATDIDAALVAKGSGATSAQVADGTTANGDNRGQYATDFQKLRGGSSAVASGPYSAMLGGQSNYASGFYSTSVNGQNNIVSSTGGFVGNSSFFGSNYVFSASTAGAVVNGGSNAVQGEFAFIGGGQYNECGQYGSPTPTGNYATIGGGQYNYISAPYSTIPGGMGASTRGVTGRFSYASYGGGYASPGHQQMGVHVTRSQVAGVTPTKLTVDGAALSSARQVNTLPDNSAYGIRCTVVARNNVGTCAAWEVSGCVKRGSGAGTTALVGSPSVTSIGADAGAAGWSVALVADTAYGAAVIQVTDSVGGTTIDWVATMYTSEVNP